MSGDGFANQILGGVGTLIRTFIQSKNFVTGVSGWQIARDGSAEFNDLIARGDLDVGTLSDGTPAVVFTGSAIPAELQTFYQGLPTGGTIYAAMIGYRTNTSQDVYQYRAYIQPAAGALIVAEGVVVSGFISELTRQRDASYGITRNNNNSGSVVTIGPDTPGLADDIRFFGVSQPRGCMFTTNARTNLTTAAQAMALGAATNFVWRSARVYAIILHGRLGTTVTDTIAIWKLLRGTTTAASVALDFGGYRALAGAAIPVDLCKFIGNGTNADITQTVQMSIQSGNANTVTWDGGGADPQEPRSMSIIDVGSTVDFVGTFCQI